MQGCGGDGGDKGEGATHQPRHRAQAEDRCGLKLYVCLLGGGATCVVVGLGGWRYGS